MQILKRIWVDLFILSVIGVLLFAVGVADKSPAGFALFLYKILLFSASQVHATILRKLLFPYIDFKSATPMQQTIVIAVHIGAAYVYAQGG